MATLEESVQASGPTAKGPCADMGRSQEVGETDNHSLVLFHPGLRAVSTTLHWHYKRRFNEFKITKDHKVTKVDLRYCHE